MYPPVGMTEGSLRDQALALKLEALAADEGAAPPERELARQRAVEARSRTSSTSIDPKIFERYEIYLGRLCSAIAQED
jgi:hypothetical protein